MAIITFEVVVEYVVDAETYYVEMAWHVLVDVGERLFYGFDRWPVWNECYAVVLADRTGGEDALLWGRGQLAQLVRIDDDIARLQNREYLQMHAFVRVLGRHLDF
jgi:hypothetical protein